MPRFVQTVHEADGHPYPHPSINFWEEIKLLQATDDTFSKAVSFGIVSGTFISSSLRPRRIASHVLVFGVTRDWRALDTKQIRFEFRHACFLLPPAKLGAPLYYLNFVLHDWPDALAAYILTQLVRAMTTGYSKLILDEFILPNTDAPLIASDFE